MFNRIKKFFAKDTREFEYHEGVYISQKALALYYTDVRNTNGCGNSWYSWGLANWLQYRYGVDFREACFWHDLERNIEQKDEEHRLMSDLYFAFNMENCLPENPTDKQYEALSLFHTAVVANSVNTYYS